MPDKRIFIAYNTQKGNILKEKFTQDAFFTIRSIETEEEYNNTFLKYREKLINIAKTINDIALKEYGKKILDLNFLVTNINAFYINNRNITLFDIEKNISLLAWFFANISKIKEVLGLEVTLKNINSFEELAKIKEAVAEQDIPLYDLWSNIVKFVSDDLSYAHLYDIIYPTPFPKTSSDAFVIHIKPISVEDYINQYGDEIYHSEEYEDEIDELDVLYEIESQVEIEAETSFEFFTKLMKATNKSKSCRLCIFTDFKTYKGYIENNHLFVIIFNPKLGFYASKKKGGLIAHVICVDKENGYVKEIADYMNDHDVDFIAPLDVLKEIDAAIMKITSPFSYLRRRDLDTFIDSLKQLQQEVELKEIKQFFNAIDFAARYLEEEEIFSESNIKNLRDPIRKRIFLKLAQTALYDHIDKNRLLSELKNYILDFESLKRDIGESNFNKILKNYENIIYSRINENLSSLLEEDSKLKTVLKAKEKSSENKTSKLLFESTLELPETNKKFIFNTTLTLDNKNIYEIVNNYPDNKIVNFHISEISALFKEENAHVFSDEKIQEITNLIADKVSKESLSTEELNPALKSHFIDLINKHLSALLLKEIKKTNLDTVTRLLKQEKQINEITFQTTADYLKDKIYISDEEKEKFINFLKEHVLPSDINVLQRKIEKIHQEINRIKDLVNSSFYNVSISSFYIQAFNMFKPTVIMHFSRIKKVIELINKVKKVVLNVVNNLSGKDLEDFNILSQIVDKIISDIADLKNFKNELESIYSSLINLAYKKIKEKQMEKLNAIVKNYIIETICLDVYNIIIKEEI